MTPMAPAICSGVSVRKPRSAGLSMAYNSRPPRPATYALEHLGGQSHAYTWGEFKQRYEEHFGELRS
jgi:hypothetical protein